KMMYFATGMIDFLIRLPFYDIVHIHTADYGTEKRKRIFARIAKIFGKKLIVHLHSCDPTTSIIGEYKDLYNYTFHNADKIILLSKTWRNLAINSFPDIRDKFHVLYNPCPTVVSSKFEERKRYILFAASVIQRKGYEDLIRAFAKIAKDFPEWELKIAGNGEIENAKQVALELGVSQQIEFLGWINGNAKDKVFRNASIYCLPSHSEGFPMGVLDAWAYHLPVVSTPVGGLPDVAVDMKNILLFTPKDIEGLSNKLRLLMSDSELYQVITNASAEFADDKFNIKNICAQLGAIYESTARAK
ncbi:MAG: glycosyltransferase family 4 protein, partial [Muribaculum sp.]|nr:glycosyltransferase family 4 protein [Muribaculum sp.]